MQEETGLRVSAESVVGVYTGFGRAHAINFVFACAVNRNAEDGQASAELPNQWHSVADVATMPADAILNPAKLRSAIADRRRRLPLDLICEDFYGKS